MFPSRRPPSLPSLLRNDPCAGRLFAPLRPWLDQLPPGPATASLSALAAAADLRTASGQPLQFTLPVDDGLGYEARIAATGCVETRPDNWHDFFNALVWLAFPKAKAALSARHQLALTQESGPRGTVRDAMTHFDECGLVVLSSDPAMLDLIREFRWKSLFWEQRQHLLATTQFILFGHGTYEQLLKPFRGLTAKAVLYEVPEEPRQIRLPGHLSGLDERLAADLAQGLYSRPRDLQPVPLLGIPGVVPENDDPAYYDDTWQFRPGRRAARV